MKQTKILISLMLVLVFAAVACSQVNKDQKSYGKGVIVKQTSGIGLLTEEYAKKCADKSYLNTTAHYIIEGTIDKTEGKWNKEKTDIFTYNYLHIENYVKGKPLKENRLTIITPGGTVGELGQIVEGQLDFKKGERVRIYLQEMNEEFTILCAPFGVKRI